MIYNLLIVGTLLLSLSLIVNNFIKELNRRLGDKESNTPIILALVHIAVLMIFAVLAFINVFVLVEFVRSLFNNG
jgi:hypothetical protein